MDDFYIFLLEPILLGILFCLMLMRKLKG